MKFICDHQPILYIYKKLYLISLTYIQCLYKPLKIESHFFQKVLYIPLIYILDWSCFSGSTNLKNCQIEWGKEGFYTYSQCSFGISELYKLNHLKHHYKKSGKFSRHYKDADGSYMEYEYIKRCRNWTT